MPTLTEHQSEVMERFLAALGDAKQLKMPDGTTRYLCFGTCRPACKVYWDIDEVCHYCAIMAKQSGDWTTDALERLKKGGRTNVKSSL